jgi:hypothetical protein
MSLVIFDSVKAALASNQFTLGNDDLDKSAQQTK